jgi:inhibitor of KinA
MEANAHVDELFYYLKEIASHLLENLFPAYHSLLVVGHTPEHIEEIRKRINEFYEGNKNSGRKRISQEKIIPVCYDPALGNDLGIMAEKLNLSTDQIIQIHSGMTYHVFMLGFLPGFPYMGLVDERIAMPRKPKPVPTKRGAVGIAGRQTGIYPANSPGGWHIVGFTPLQLFDQAKENPALLGPGDEVRFLSVDLETYKTIADHEL